MPHHVIRSEISGQVWKVEASVGQRLSEGNSIVILESMKMEIPVSAPVDCTVVDIVVVEGATVAEGDVIAHVEQ